MKIHYTHIKRIEQLFKERFNLTELHIMYKGKIEWSTLRSITSNIKRNEKV